MQKNNKEFYEQHFKNLRNLLQENGCFHKNTFYALFMIFISIFLYIGGLLFMGDFPFYINIIFFYIIIVELGYISHDLIHNHYFKNHKINTFFSFISGNLLIGLSNGWWRKKHNVEHHSFTNSDIHDSDIRDYDEIFTSNEGKSKFFNKHKKVLFWCSTTLLYFNLIYLSLIYAIKGRRYLELITLFGNIFLLPLFLVLHFGYLGILYLIIIYILVGVHLAFAFMVNHIGMEIIDGEKISKYCWLDLQTRTTRNIKGGVFINHLFGGLNKQIEHHLFPMIPRNNVLKASKIVKKYCLDNGIKYHEVGFFEGLKEIQNTLTTGNTK